MEKLVRGVGLYKRGKYACFHLGKITKEYSLWDNMLQRCYNDVYHISHPSYIGCSLSENFKNFQYFAEWCQNQKGFGEKEFQIDKDILFKGNKLYSEETCVFVPREINMLLVKSESIRGDWPVGVSWHKKGKKFVAQLKAAGKNRYLGLFSSSEEAYEVYKKAKESEIKRLAQEYREHINVLVYNALMSYIVEEND